MSYSINRVGIGVTLLGVALAALFTFYPRHSAAQSGERCFPETNQCISGAIRTYWEQHGGLPVFGYPTTPQRVETVEDRTIPVQWFERDRLEIQADGRVTAGRLGARLLEIRKIPWRSFETTTSQEAANQPIPCTYFAETEHSMCVPFAEYWQQNGGLERFGYPITEAFEETVQGRRLLVQYFERRRMEFHPDKRGTPYEVLLGLLGHEVWKLTAGPPTGRIAFHDDMNGNYDIWVINPDGTERQRLTTDPDNDARPAWSPDGTRIAFDTQRHGYNEIYIINADGTGETRLTTSRDRYSFAPTWSPDGTRIAYIVQQDERFDVYVIDLREGNNPQPVRLTPDGSKDSSPSWSPDGTQIAFVSDRDGGTNRTYIMDADGSNAALLTLPNPLPTGSLPIWSPNGTLIAFTPSVDFTDTFPDVYMAYADGSRQLQLTTDPATDADPTWSPYNRYVAFTSYRDGGQNISIYIIHGEGMGLTRLTRGSDPAWSSRP